MNLEILLSVVTLILLATLQSTSYRVFSFFTGLRLTKYSPLLLLALPSLAQAEEAIKPLDLTQHWVGYTALVLFVLAYFFAMIEEVTDLRKSKPMVFAASLIWVFIAAIYANNGMSEQAGTAFRISLEAYVELFLFIMVSMTYLNAMEDRGVFERLRVWLLSKNFSYRQLFWITRFLWLRVTVYSR